MVATKIRQYGTLFWKADNNKINITSSQGKVITTIFFVFQMVSCVNLCCYVNLSSQVIQYQEQSNLASPLLVNEPMDLEELMTYGCTSLAWITKWLFLENQQSLPPWLGLPSGRRYPRQSAIPQGVDDLFIQDGMALLHTFTNLPPSCCEICIQILDQTAISTASYQPGLIKSQERLRRSSPHIILAGTAVRQPYYSKGFHANYDTKKQLCQLCCMEWQAGPASRLDRTNMVVFIVEGRIHQFVTTYS